MPSTRQCCAALAVLSPVALILAVCLSAHITSSPSSRFRQKELRLFRSTQRIQLHTASAGAASVPARSVNAASVPARSVNASKLFGRLDKKCIPTPDAERATLLDFGTTPTPPHCHDDFCVGVERALAASTQCSLVLTVAHWPEQRGLLEAWTTAAAALRVPACALLSMSDGSTSDYLALEATGISIVPLPTLPAATTSTSPSSPGVLPRKWLAIAKLLAMRVSVLYTDVDGVLTHPPFALLANDSDVEVLSDAWDDEAAKGFIHGSDDPSMGWGR